MKSRPLSAYLACLGLFLITAWSPASANAATVTYVFGPVVNDGITGSGTMTFASPPAMASAGWSSFSLDHLINWTFTRTGTTGSGNYIDHTATMAGFLEGLYGVTYSNPQSLAGNELDSGYIFHNDPYNADFPDVLFSFASTPGSDTVTFGGFTLDPGFLGPFAGNWTAAVPIPSALYLLGSGLLALIGFARYKRKETPAAVGGLRGED